MPRFVVGLIIAISAIAVSGRPAVASPVSSPAGAPAPAPEIGYPVHMDVSPPLRTLQQTQQEEVSDRGKDRGAKHLQTSGQSGVAGSPSGSTPANAPATSSNFEGVGQGFTGPAGTFAVQAAPPDPNGAVGPNHYVETVNMSFAIFNRSGTPLYGPVKINTLWSGFGGGCQADNDGDPTVVYDRIADRWLISQFAVTTTHYLNCVAVSTTPDPTGTYTRYSYSYTDFPDYPKVGLWPDGYYVTFNMFKNGTTFNGAKACSYDRLKMVAGLSATQVCFNTSTTYGSLLPSTLDGARLPPAGSPNYFVALGASTTTLASWKFHVDWTTPSSSTFTGPTALTVPAYAKACSGGGTCIQQPGTTQRLDSLGDRLMYRLAYRNFGDHEALVVNHSVTAGTSVGIRWYELRVASGALSLFQQGTYAPDATYRWMGSIAMDQAGDIALGYSASSSSVNPSIRYTGRFPGDPAGTMAQGEGSIIAGAGSQFSSANPLSRWGDYTSMAVDPVDDCTFWYTNQYLKANGTFNWSTRIGTFKFAGCGTPTVSGISPTSGPAGGGTVVTITGTGFATAAGATTVKFGATAATTVSCASMTSCTAKSPAGSGTVDVGVTVAGLASAPRVSDQFTYIGSYTISGTVRNAAGTALANVSVQPYAGATCCTYITQSITDASGTYSLTLQAGSYRLFVNPGGSSPYPVQWYGGPDFSSATPITLSANTTVNITVSGESFTISGTVRNAAGTALANVSVQPYAGATCCTYTTQSITDASGTYSLTLQAGTYRLFVNPGGSSPYPVQWYGGTDFSSATPITLSANTTVNITLH